MNYSMNTQFSNTQPQVSDNERKRNRRITDIAVASIGVIGLCACAVGITAAAIGTTCVTTAMSAGYSVSVISKIGRAVGGALVGVSAAVFGSGVGVVTCGTGFAGTIPLAIGGVVVGMTIGGKIATKIAKWAGIPIAKPITVVTKVVPSWAIPIAVIGGTLAVGAIGYGIYRLIRRHKGKGISVTPFDSNTAYALA